MEHKFDIKFIEYDELYSFIADQLTKEKIIGWFQGKTEWGPRALGNRSIIGDPRDPKMQKDMNLRIKYRESFRPFAPSVLEEEAYKFFKISKFSKYHSNTN